MIILVHIRGLRIKFLNANLVKLIILTLLTREAHILKIYILVKHVLAAVELGLQNFIV